MDRLIVTLLVGLGAGFGLGYWMAPDGADEAQAEETDRAAQEASGTTPGERKLEIRRPAMKGGQSGPMRIVTRVRTPEERNFQDVAACTREVERLDGEMAQLAQLVAGHEKEKEFQQGKPVAFPEELDPKFLEPALMKNLNEAFKEAGVPGDVSFVDCDEYPCIACANLPAPDVEGSGLDNPLEAIEKVRGTKALSPYEDAKQQNTVFTRREMRDGGTERSTGTCMSFYPNPGDAQALEELNQRLSWRMGQMHKSM